MDTYTYRITHERGAGCKYWDTGYCRDCNSTGEIEVSKEVYDKFWKRRNKQTKEKKIGNFVSTIAICIVVTIVVVGVFVQKGLIILVVLSVLLVVLVVFEVLRSILSK